MPGLLWFQTHDTFSVQGEDRKERVANRELCPVTEEPKGGQPGRAGSRRGQRSRCNSDGWHGEAAGKRGTEEASVAAKRFNVPSLKWGFGPDGSSVQDPVITGGSSRPSHTSENIDAWWNDYLRKARRWFHCGENESSRSADTVAVLSILGPVSNLVIGKQWFLKQCSKSASVSSLMAGRREAKKTNLGLSYTYLLVTMKMQSLNSITGSWDHVACHMKLWWKKSEAKRARFRNRKKNGEPPSAAVEPPEVQPARSQSLGVSGCWESIATPFWFAAQSPIWFMSTGCRVARLKTLNVKSCLALWPEVFSGDLLQQHKR